MKALKILLLIGMVLLGVIITGCNYELISPLDAIDANEAKYDQLWNNSDGRYPTLEGRME